MMDFQSTPVARVASHVSIVYMMIYVENLRVNSDIRRLDNRFFRYGQFRRGDVHSCSKGCVPRLKAGLAKTWVFLKEKLSPPGFFSFNFININETNLRCQCIVIMLIEHYYKIR